MSVPVSTWAAAFDADLATLAPPQCDRAWPASAADDLNRYRQHRCTLAAGHDGPHRCRYACRSEYRGGRWSS